MVKLISLWPVLLLVLTVIPMDGGAEDPEEENTDLTPHGFSAGMGSGFVENMGQFPDAIRYVASTSYGYTALGEDRVYHYMINEDRMQVVRIDMEGGNALSITPSERTSTVYNYIRGGDPEKWATGLRSYGRIRMEDVWDGIDIVYKVKERSIKYDIEIEPGSDMEDLIFTVSGHSEISGGAEGLQIEIGPAILRDSELVSIEEDGSLTPSSVRIIDDNSYTFVLPEWDGRSKVTIDPLLYATYLGGIGWEDSKELEMSPDGDILITGTTNSPDLPTPPGVYIENPSNSSDVFLCKIDPEGGAPDFLTYVGGNKYETGRSVKLDDSGNIYICGETESTDFPITDGALNPDYLGGESDAFVLKLSPNGSALKMSTYLGGDDYDMAFSLAITSDGDLVVVGDTRSSDIDCTYGAFETIHKGGFDMFVIRMNDTDRKFTTYIGDKGHDCARRVVLDEEDNPVICGFSTSGKFPTTYGAYQKSNKGKHDAVILKLNSSFKTLIYSTMVGGSNADYAYDLDLDSDGLPYVTGYTHSSSFPVMAPAHDILYNATAEGFVFKLGNDAKNLKYSTFVGNGSYTSTRRIQVLERSLYVYGYSTSRNLPGDGRGYDTVYDKGRDAILIEMSKDLKTVDYATYYGSEGEEGIGDFHVHNETHITVTGSTSSVPIHLTEDAYQKSFGGYRDLFIANIDVRTVPSEPVLVSAEVGESWINLDWTHPMDDGGYEVDYYEIYKSTAPGEEDLYVTIYNGTSFNDTRVEMGISYFYFVRGVNRLGRGLISTEVNGSLEGTAYPPRDLRSQWYDSGIHIEWKPSSWTAGIDFLGYKVYWKEYNGSFELLQTLPPNRTSLEVNYLVNGYQYSFYVTGWTDEGETDSTNIVTSVPKTHPTPPRNLTVSTVDHEAVLSWRPPVSDGGSPVEAYHIFRNRNRGENRCIMAVGGDILNFTDEDIVFGIEYSYSVRAVNIVGVSNLSGNSSVKFVGPPGKPTIPTVSLENGKAHLTWSPPVKTGGYPIVSYRIYRGMERSGIQLFQVLPGDQLEFTDDTVSPGHVYRYAISAETEWDESARTEELFLTVSDFPSRPTQLRGRAGNGYVGLDWNPPLDNGLSSIDRYIIKRSSDGGEFAEYEMLAGSVHSYNDSNVDNGKVYRYVLIAENSVGLSPYSEILELKPMGPPSPPRYVRAEARDNSVTLRWMSPLDYGGSREILYKVYKGESPRKMDKEIDVGSEMILNDANVYRGVTYYYSVVAVGDGYTSESTHPVSAIILNTPLSPTNFDVKLVDDGVKLVWGRPADDGGSEILLYRIYRSNGSEDYHKIGEVKGGNFTYVDDTVNGPAYADYYIVAVNKEGTGPRTYSESIYVTGENSGDDPEDKNWDLHLLIMGLAASILVVLILLSLMLRKAVAMRRSGPDSTYHDHPVGPPMGQSWYGDDPNLPEADLLDE